MNTAQEPENSCEAVSPFRILLAPDKFKGSLSALEVAGWLESGLISDGGKRTIYCRSLPLADGGDGSVQAVLEAGFRPFTVEVPGPTGIPAATIVALDGFTAVVEAATTVGLQMLPGGRLAPLASSSNGFGVAVRAAHGRGPKRIVLALGGSATTDGGAGMLSGLGAQFFNGSGEVFVPCGGNLKDITRIDLGGLCDLSGVDLIAANDVQNPLLGPTGTAAVYGPQKGAAPSDVVILDEGLANLVNRLDEAGLPGTSCALSPGAGSAGGLGYAALLLGARMVSGADFFMDLLGFEQALKDCDLVITGEGKMDDQTLSGKLPLVVARRSMPVPVIAVVGHNALEKDRMPEYNIQQIYSLSNMTDQDSAIDSALSARLLTAVGRQISQTLERARGVRR